jgi:hypothetical protein
LLNNEADTTPSSLRIDVHNTNNLMKPMQILKPQKKQVPNKDWSNSSVGKDCELKINKESAINTFHILQYSI